MNGTVEVLGCGCVSPIVNPHGGGFSSDLSGLRVSVRWSPSIIISPSVGVPSEASVAKPFPVRTEWAIKVGAANVKWRSEEHDPGWKV
ncbi:thiazole synthase [Anopheles sinensis]|uniref:Thiazole synthase n=1 Tax=Anopheles sinensis TaxID=74873 RepID=A0A084WJT1_ANOSI|nr:thiazole synthase [Anopheles sinensis]